jgi:lipopolysaccharide/colanic/teichoic acid biosynthesis glycosyltransferase
MLSRYDKASEPLRRPTNASNPTVARVLDVVVACAALVLLAPVMVLVAAAIFIEDGRPIFFSQLRLGHRGRHFRIHKFRKFR